MSIVYDHEETIGLPLALGSFAGIVLLIVPIRAGYQPGLNTKRWILSPTSFAVAGYVRAAQVRSAVQAVLPIEQDSLQEKGIRKDFDWASS